MTLQSWTKIFFAVFLSVLVSLPRADAQVPVDGELQSPPPIMGSSDIPAVAPASDASSPVTASGFGGADGVYRILVLGDALAGGLGAGMNRIVQGDARFEIANRFNESSGLSRPEVYDWIAAIPKIMATQPYDAVVVHVGVNDRQGIRSGSTRLVFKAPEWTAAYEAQIDALLSALKAQNVKVYWVSLPPMANPDFDADMQFLADLHRKHVEAAGATYVDVRPSLLGTDGKYTDRGPDETGVDRKLRTRDGITFLKQGNSRFGQLVVAAIKAKEGLDAGATVAAAPVAAAPATTPTETVTTPVTPPPSAVETNAAILLAPSAAPVAAAPTMGQDGLGGETMAFQADGISAGGETPTRRKATAVAAQTVQIKRKIDAVDGSNAQKLFVEGRSAVAPKGRFDDFSYVAPETAQP